MTRFLAESLQARDPAFRLRLRELERANGNPNTDIRLSVEITEAVRSKLPLLGLDPHNTTAQELYGALQGRALQDDKLLARTLQTLAATHISAAADITAGMAYALQQVDIPKTCFALKPAVLKSLLKKSIPKKAMKQLGYRSADSMLKHENPMLIVAAAHLSETASWRRGFLEQYKRLRSSDFEIRPLAIMHPTTKYWRTIAQSTLTQHKHNLLSFQELGAVVLLPLPTHAPAGAATASLLFALNACNEIRASGLFLQLCQVRADFGNLVRQVANHEATIHTPLLKQAMPLPLIQRALSRLDEGLHETLPAPQIDHDAFSWQPLSVLLQQIEPRLEFWKQTEHLGVMHNGQLVSLNLLDTALGLCNHIPFEQRLAQYYQQSLWHELLVRYLQPQAVEQALQALLQPKLAPEPIIA